MSESLKILLIDDDKFVLKATSKLFRKYDVEVITCMDPEEGLNAVVDLKPQLVFLDYNMPGLTGEDVIVRVSEEKAFNDVALYMLSANDFTEAEVIKMRTLGFYNVLNKPLTFKVIDQIFVDHFGSVPFKAA
ncbi:MAG: response regulator [Halobacteriovoraceae bacterium]|nr:response regulator [Halobacteriovoraceae bacterium]